MKKFLLLFTIAIGYLSAQSQVSFNASPTTVTSGNNVTLTSSGETASAYLSTISSVTTNNSNVTAVINGTPNYGFGSTSTTLVIIVTYPSGTGAVPVTLTVHCSLYDVNAQTEFPETYNVSQTVNVNPATIQSTTYWNVAESGTFNTQGCSAKSMGEPVTYTVPAHTYSSTSSQSAANQLAISSVTANGQNYANAHPQCVAVYARLQGYPRSGDGTQLQARFYADAACTIPLALPSNLNFTVTFYKYTYGILNDPTTYGISQVYTVAQGATYLSFIHLEFYSTNPGAPWTPNGDIFASVALETGNPNFTTEPFSGTLTHD